MTIFLNIKNISNIHVTKIPSAPVLTFKLNDSRTMTLSVLNNTYITDDSGDVVYTSNSTSLNPINTTLSLDQGSYHLHEPPSNLYITNLDEIEYWDTTSNHFQSFRLSSPYLTSVPDQLPSSVTSTNHMFNGCTSFNQNISSWDVSLVTTANYMFYGCAAFNQDISNMKFESITTNPIDFSTNSGLKDMDKLPVFETVVHRTINHTSYVSTTTSPSTLIPSPNNISKIIHIPELNKYVMMVGYSSTTSSNGKIYTSSDGINWKQTYSTTSYGLRDIAWSSKLRRLVAVGIDSLILYSSNGGDSWTRSSYSFSGKEQALYTVSWVEELSTFFLAGVAKYTGQFSNTLRYFYSTNGTTFSEGAVEYSNNHYNILDIVWNTNTKKLAFYGSSSSHVVFTYNDKTITSKDRSTSTRYARLATGVQEELFVFNGRSILLLNSNRSAVRKSFTLTLQTSETILCGVYSNVKRELYVVTNTRTHVVNVDTGTITPYSRGSSAGSGQPRNVVVDSVTGALIIYTTAGTYKSSVY